MIVTNTRTQNLKTCLENVEKIAEQKLYPIP